MEFYSKIEFIIAVNVFQNRVLFHNRVFMFIYFYYYYFFGIFNYFISTYDFTLHLIKDKANFFSNIHILGIFVIPAAQSIKK